MTVRLAGPGELAALARLRCQWGDEWGEAGMGEAEFAAAFSQWAAQHEGATGPGWRNWTAARSGRPGLLWSTASAERADLLEFDLRAAPH